MGYTDQRGIAGVTAVSKRSTSPCVPAGSRIYAVGDIHGRLDLLDRLLERIRSDAAGHVRTRKVVVFLGDLVDRGPHSKEVVDRLMDGVPAGRDWADFKFVVLRGNHESTMLDFLKDESVGPMWLRNGGLATIYSYLGFMPDHLPGPVWMTNLRAALVEALPPGHREFLEGLKLAHEEGDYLFVHAGVRPGVAIDQQDDYDLMWIRTEFLISRLDHGRLVVHGHTISREPDVRDNRIGIDTGAFATGRLTALVLEGTSRAFITT
jgi:serine/threonine protein phosphatase 1